MPREVSFRVNKADRALVQQIVARWMVMVVQRFPTMTKSQIAMERQGVTMDLEATHANGNRMDFEKLLAADDFTFAHDVSGIGRHLDRRTGKLTGFFVPRCSAAKKNLRGRTSRSDKRLRSLTGGCV